MRNLQQTPFVERSRSAPQPCATIGKGAPVSQKDRRTRRRGACKRANSMIVGVIRKRKRRKLSKLRDLESTFGGHAKEDNPLPLKRARSSRDLDSTGGGKVGDDSPLPHKMARSSSTESESSSSSCCPAEIPMADRSLVNDENSPLATNQMPRVEASPPDGSFQSTFTVLSCLGDALFGEVLLVRHNASNDLRAVKKVLFLPPLSLFHPHTFAIFFVGFFCPCFFASPYILV